MATSIMDAISKNDIMPKIKNSLEYSANSPASMGNNTRASDPADPNIPRIFPCGPTTVSLENSPIKAV